jgi:hypothetical protein
MSRPLTGTRNNRRFSPSLEAATVLALWRARTCFVLALIPFLSASAFAGLAGFHDPEFEKYPLGAWMTAGTQTHLRWRVEIPTPELSTHQRLMMRIITRVDGREIEKRRAGKGFLTLMQVQDSAGHTWQNHAELDFKNIHQNVNQSDFTFTHFAFVLPGDYTVTVAVCDTVTLEHSVIVRKVHVNAPRTEPFPNAWEGLPPVEFITSLDGPPDVWYLPEIESHLNLPVRSSRPLHIQILVNTTPSERAAASITTIRRNMSLSIPAMKILSQLRIPGSTIDTALLDLTHRRVPFEQKAVNRLEWSNMRRYFADAQPAMVDVSALQGQWKMRPFFWDEVTRRLHRDGDAIPIVIVLSGPAFFGNQESVEPSHLDPESGRRLFYIRYRTPSIVRPQHVRVRPGMKPPFTVPELDPLPLDDLERTVEPLGARIFDATSPDQFRRVLAAILEQISKL